MMYSSPGRHGLPPVYQVRGIIPLSNFKVAAGESLLYYLTSYGASVEDILLEGIRLIVSSSGMLDRSQIEFYCDTGTIEHGYEVIASQATPNVTLNEVINKYLDAVYLLYTTSYFEMRYLFQNFTVSYEPSSWDIAFSEIKPLGFDVLVTVDLMPDQGEPA